MSATAVVEASEAGVLSDDERYEAVSRRDRALDGAFYYAVRSTGVYCRPSCGARLARRENVSFHPSCAAAEDAGFRACRRCRPSDKSAGSPHRADGLALSL